MITQDQAKYFSKKLKISESVVLREYIQLLFLSKLYTYKESKDIFFKGGTAIHLIYKAPRFSEDLDFTVEMQESNFLHFIKRIFSSLEKEENLSFKERKTITGKRYLISADVHFTNYKIYINLDFSFREKVYDPQKSVITSTYPVIFSSYVYHFSKEELFAEKIRAIMTRKKGRDIYDLWYLITQGVTLNEELIKKKLLYYRLQFPEKRVILERIENISEKDFINDIRPFIPIGDRGKLPQFFQYLKDFLKEKLT